MRRPALWTALFFATGIGIQIFWDVSQWILVSGAAAIMMACLLGLKMRWVGGMMSVLLAVLLMLLGALRWTQSQWVGANSLSRFLPSANTPVEIFGQVVSEPESVGDDRRVVFAVKQLTVQDTIWSVQLNMVWAIGGVWPCCLCGARLGRPLNTIFRVGLRGC